MRSKLAGIVLFVSALGLLGGGVASAGAATPVPVHHCSASQKAADEKWDEISHDLDVKQAQHPNKEVKVDDNHADAVDHALDVECSV
jgi:hypothetical protein